MDLMVAITIIIALTRAPPIWLSPHSWAEVSLFLWAWAPMVVSG
jgi:hypothetical protein